MHTSDEGECTAKVWHVAPSDLSIRNESRALYYPGDGVQVSTTLSFPYGVWNQGYEGSSASLLNLGRRLFHFIERSTSFQVQDFDMIISLYVRRFKGLSYGALWPKSSWAKTCAEISRLKVPPKDGKFESPSMIGRSSRHKRIYRY